MLRARLVARGFSDEDSDGALATLERTGLLDDRRFAEGRARSLAARGAGDAFIRHRLQADGIEREVVDDALAALRPEPERAERIVGRRGAGPRTARYLRLRGFSEEAVARAVAGDGPDEIG